MLRCGSCCGATFGAPLKEISSRSPLGSKGKQELSVYWQHGYRGYAARREGKMSLEDIEAGGRKKVKKRRLVVVL